MKAVGEFGNEFIGVLFPEYPEGSPFQIHHCVGRSYVHNKIHIGHYFILPVPFDLHDPNGNHPLNVTHYRKAFCNKYGSESALFQVMYSAMIQFGMCEELPEGVYEAIMDTKR